MAEKSVENLLESIKESKNIPFDRVLFALGIRYVGITVAKKLAYYFETIDNIINATKEDLIQAEEIGDRIADSIIEYFSNNDNILLIDKLKEQDIQFVIVKTKQDSNIFENKSIVVSGKFIQKTRDEIKGLIERNGGKVVSSVSSNTHLIVSGENMGPSKLAKAKKLDILIYSEQEFLLKIEHNQQFNDENNIVQTKLDL
jgi:DNA ligase (NAD+)